MNPAAKLMIQVISDVTIVDFQDARLLETQKLEAIGHELYNLVDKMNRKKIILDFTKVDFLASAAVGMIINLNTKATGIKGSLVICGLKKDLMKVFEIMKLTKILRFAPTEKDALGLLGYTGSS